MVKRGGGGEGGLAVWWLWGECERLRRDDRGHVGHTVVTSGLGHSEIYRVFTKKIGGFIQNTLSAQITPPLHITFKLEINSFWFVSSLL